MTVANNTVAIHNNKPSVKVVIAAVAGNTLEFYDFIVFSFFAIDIGKAFFPGDDETLKLLATLAVYGAGFCTRPLGGYFIGTFADKKGRKAAMILTVSLITVGTMGLALTPSYEKIGIIAPVIVLMARLIQGFGLGGEVGPVSALLVEMAPKGKRAFYASWQVASQGIAVIVAGLFGMLVSSLLTEAQMSAWGWRLPFLVSLLLVPVAFYIRKSLPETLEKTNEQSGAKLVGRVVSGYRRYFILGILIMMAATISVQVGNYMTTYAIDTLKLSAEQAQMATVSGGVMMLVFSLVAGYLADKYSRKSIMIWSRFMLMLIITPLFFLLEHDQSLFSLLVATICIVSLSSMNAAICLVAIPEMMPIAVRATGVSLIYSISACAFGGTAQFVVLWLQKNVGLGPASPAYYVVFASLISLVAMYMMPETKNFNVKE